MLKTKKMSTVVLLSILLIFEYYLIYYRFDMQHIKYLSNHIPWQCVLLGWIGIANIVVTILMWKRMTGEVFCPYIVFYIVLQTFCFGQSFGWVFGLELEKDLLRRHPTNIIVNGQIFTLFGIAMFNLGAVISYSKKRILKRANFGSSRSEEFTQACRKVSKWMIFITLPVFVVYNIILLVSVARSGYEGYFEVNQQGKLLVMMSMIADYFEPALLLGFISNPTKKHMRNIFILYFIDIVCILYMGGRSNAVMLCIVIVLMYHYYIKKIRKSVWLFIGGIGYVAMAILTAIQQIRGNIGKTLSEMIMLVSQSLPNALGSFLGEMGWSMSSLLYTMQLVPDVYPYRKGSSYLWALTSAIPNIGFWNIHPAKIYAELAVWLKQAMNFNFGPGYTMVAEAYINFGQYGLVAMLVAGIIMGYFLTLTDRQHAKQDFIGTIIMFLVIMTIMRRLVRSSFSASVRIIVYTILVIYALIKYTAYR